jgi:hypothetical protein
MARRRKNTVILEQIGFYLVNSQGEVRSKTVNKGKPGDPDRKSVVEPTRYRTIAAALDICEALGPDWAILRTVVENFAWGE